MIIRKKLVEALLNGTANDQEKAEVRQRLLNAENMHVVAHEHREGTDIFAVQLSSAHGPTDIKRLLCSHDPDHFEFHSRGDEYLPGIEDLSLSVIDLRDVVPLSDEELIDRHGGQQYLLDEFPDSGSSPSLG